MRKFDISILRIPLTVVALTVLVMAVDSRCVTRIEYDLRLIPTVVVAADLNGDSFVDLIATHTQLDSVAILINNGVSGYLPATNFGLPGSPRGVAAADLDGDLDADLAITCVGSGSIEIMKNNGDGTFQFSSSIYAASNPKDIYAADLDGDGDLDIAATRETFNYPGADIIVLLNLGDGTFDGQSNYWAGEKALALCGADFDGDGDRDLAVVNNDNLQGLWILNNNGLGSFYSHTTYNIGMDLNLGADADICSADLDGDGDNDLAITGWTSHKVALVMNNGDGTFQEEVLYDVYSPSSILATDIDSDNDIDLVVSSYWPKTIYIMRNSGSGLFIQNGTYLTLGLPSSVCIADVDADGVTDLAVANEDRANVSVFFSLTGFAQCGDADNNKLMTVSDVVYLLQYIFSGGPAPNPIELGDADGDGVVLIADAIFVLQFIFSGGVSPHCN